MAYEIFDDIAFFYLATSILAMAVLPWSLFKLGAYIYNNFISRAKGVELTRIQKLKLEQIKSQDTSSHTPNCTCVLCTTKRATTIVKEKKPLWTCGNITLMVLWVLFILMLLQIPNFQHENLVSFQPYDILEIDSKATDAEIKSAYRKLSLRYHPDKNVDNPDAAQKFLMVVKAYETLTDPKAKENMEKYNNPDGYKGISVTIGLPSWLTKKENELRVLIIYFLIFILLPPIAVFIWWRSAKDYMDGNILKRTLQYYHWFIGPNMGPKFLIELLGMAGEYESLRIQSQQEFSEFKSLSNEVKEGMVKQRFNDPKKFGNRFEYSHKASVLLHAYMMRVPIPATFQNDLNILLKDAHRLLNVMFDVASSRQFLRPMIGCYELMQMITQGIFAHESPLLQLPFLNKDHTRKLMKKNIKTIHQFKKATRDKLSKILEDLTDSQWSSIDSVSDLIPEIEIDLKYGVEDEEGIYEDDLVTLSITLDRVSFDPDKPESNTTRVSSQDDGDDSPELNNKQEEAVSPKRATPAVEMTSLSDESKSDDSASSTASLVTTSTELTAEDLDKMPVPKNTKSIPVLNQTGPTVHSLTYTLPKYERWVIILLEKSKKGGDRIVGVKRVTSFFDHADVELQFLAPRAKSAKEDGLKVGDSDVGIYEYEVHALCDSYIGCDQVKSFKIKVQKPKSKAKAQGADGEAEEEVKEEEVKTRSWLDPDEDYVGYWYYLGFASFWELVLNAIVLALLCVFIFNFLVSRGYWQRYIQPGVDFASYYTTPVFQLLYPYLAPVLDPMLRYYSATYAFIANALHRDLNAVEEVAIENIPGMGQEEEPHPDL